MLILPLWIELAPGRLYKLSFRPVHIGLVTASTLYRSRYTCYPLFRLDRGTPSIAVGLSSRLASDSPP